MFNNKLYSFSLERIKEINMVNIQDGQTSIEIIQSDGHVVLKNTSILEAAAFLCTNLNWRIIKMMTETLINLKYKINKLKTKNSYLKVSLFKEKITNPTLFEVRSLFK